MILLFPDTDTLKLALASSIVGPDVTLAPAALTIDGQGRYYVEPAVSLSRTTMKNLDRIGVKGSKRHGSTSPEKVANWLQIVPLQKEGGTPALASQAPVLFELESADDLPVLVIEMLRLGNDKQAFRWFEDARVLLRVLGPPYYTLLRALDKTAAGTVGGVRAYLERAPRVWVEIGHTHPYAAQIRTPEDQLVLLRSPRQWLFLDEAPFQDVYDILQFELPKIPVGWNETTAPQKMTVPLKLAAGNAADVPELWVLRDDALTQLDAFVRDADASLTQRLTFAVAADAKGNRVVVLRTRPSKLAPPTLPLENTLGFKPFWKLPNLFLPAGKRLHPTLRRDAVRRLLADDPDQVVWLQPDGQGGFIPESVPDAAFRSLEDWVDYVIETEQAALAAWIEATRFDFDQFICPDPGGPKPKPDAPDKERPKDEEIKLAKPAAPKPARGKAAPQPVANAELAPPEAQAASAWRIQREGLEEKFLAVEGSLEVPARRALWPQLAAANSGEGSQAEAAICWLNALWNQDSRAGRDSRSESSPAGQDQMNQLHGQKRVKDETLVEMNRKLLQDQQALRSEQKRKAELEKATLSLATDPMQREAASESERKIAALQMLIGESQKEMDWLRKESKRIEHDIDTQRLTLVDGGARGASHRSTRPTEDSLGDNDSHSADFLKQWVNAEFPDADRSLDAKEFDRRLAARKPSVEDLRSLVAGFLWLSSQKPPPRWLLAHLPTIQKFFETHEASMPVRAVWLVAVQQARLAGADVLGLARVRDRLLLRLLEEGLCAERDLPLFLRYAGLKDSARLRVVRDKALELHQTVRKWTEPIPVNLPFVDLLFAFALAKLGESTAAKKLMDDARQAMEEQDSADAQKAPAKKSTSALANEFFFPAFAYRIDQTLLNKPHRGPFPAEVLAVVKALGEKVEEIRRERAEPPANKNPQGKGAASKEPREPTTTMNSYWEAEVVIDRLRQESRILEPNEIPDPYRAIRGALGDADRQYIDLIRLTDIHNPKELSDRVRRYYKQSVTSKTPKEWRCRVLHQALTLAPRIGEQFALELLNLVPEALTPEGITIANPPTRSEITRIRGELIDRALILAAQYNQAEYVQKIIDQFVNLIRIEPEESRFLFVSVAMGQCLRNLKKLGMLDRIDRLLVRVQSQLSPGRTAGDLRVRLGARAESWIQVLQARLHLASGWLMIGQHAHATEIIDATRAELYETWWKRYKATDTSYFTELSQAYIATLGYGHSEMGIILIREYFDKVPAAALSNTWTGKQTYSRLHLKVVEEVVHAVISDEFALGPAGRKWLDDDEYIVRNRIHADMKSLRDRSGV